MCQPGKSVALSLAIPLWDVVLCFSSPLFRSYLFVLILELMPFFIISLLKAYGASVIRPFGFQGFLNRENQKKPKKTLKHGNMETHVCFPGNLPAGCCQVKPSEVNPDLTLYYL